MMMEGRCLTSMLKDVLAWQVHVKLCPLFWFGFFKTMKLLLSVLRDFLSGGANLDTGLVGSSSQIFNDDILVPHGSLLRKI